MARPRGIRCDVAVKAMILGAAMIAAAPALAGCTAAPAADPTPTILVSVDRCGTGWSSPTAGRQHFTLHNVDTRAGEVYLTDAGSGAVYAEIDPIGPGTSVPLDLRLAAGSYAFRCAMEDEQTVIGPTVKVTGSATNAPASVEAVSQADLIAATQAYEGYVRQRIPVLARLTGVLRTDLDRGALARARTDWLAAHLEYERLGAAYGAFGDLDAAINGLPDGLPDGVADPAWSGFHDIEYGLWHGGRSASLAAAGDALAKDVGALATKFAAAQIDPLELSIRAHEITENALQFELTGKTDFGSHSNLATIGADLEGTTAVLDILDPLLQHRYAGLPATRALLAQAEKDVAAATGPLTGLSTPERERLDADISQLCEQLAPIASILEPRRVKQ